MKLFPDSKFQIPNSGFSLVEASVAIGVFSMITVGLIALVSFILTTSNKSSTVLSDQGQANKIVFTIIKELRNAQTSASGAYALDTAGNQQLIFYTNTGSEIDRINYYIQSGVLKKGVTRPTGSPPSYNLASETITTVQNDIGNSSNPLFYYYNDSYNGVTGSALTQPVNVTNVKFVKINLMVLNKGGILNTNTYTVTAGGTIRNLKTNLGN